jgi:hypothetical protein
LRSSVSKRAAGGMIAVLKAKNVKKSYHLGKVIVPALHRVSFEVKENEFLTIFGPYKPNSCRSLAKNANLGNYRF